MDVEAACYTLGWPYGGSSQKYNMFNRWSESEIPFLMDNVLCESASQNFLSCLFNGPNFEDCDHTQNVYLTCFESGKVFESNRLIFFKFFCPDFLMQFTGIENRIIWYR